MLTPIAGSILSVHAHAIGASHGPLEFDINTFLGALDAISGNLAKNRAKKGTVLIVSSDVMLFSREIMTYVYTHRRDPTAVGAAQPHVI
jgi:hypothetical protein